jgi:hypothetical protein
MPAHRNLAVRVPEELARAVESLLEQRRTERPHELPSQGALLRELLSRGLESVAAERPRK